MEKFEEILAGIPQEIKTLEVDVEKKVFRLNGIDFAEGCDFFQCPVKAERISRSEWSWIKGLHVPVTIFGAISEKEKLSYLKRNNPKCYQHPGLSY